jgi:hypothetical protein
MISFYGHQGERYIGIPFDRIATLVSESVTMERVAAEVRIALAEDEGFRILVREGVRDTMARLNIAEVVALAVKDQFDKLLKEAEKRLP